MPSRSPSAPPASPAPRGYTVWGSAIAWFLPLVALAIAGLWEKGGGLLPGFEGLVLAFGTCAAAAGLAAGAAALALARGAGGGRAASSRRAMGGIALSSAALVALGAGAWSGSASARRTEADVAREIDRAMRDFPGWNGAGALDGTLVLASEVAPESPLARRLLRPYAAPFRIVLFVVDNGAGSRDVDIDVTKARLLRSGGSPPLGAVDPLAIEERVLDPAAQAALGRRSVVRVPRGGRFDGLQAIFPADASLRDVTAIEIRIGGVRRAISGRYFLLEEKRAIDAARGRTLSAR